MTRPTNRIPSLDGLRAISIALVLAGHAASTLPESLRPSGIIQHTLFNAPLGVKVFFVLSGYLITKLLLKEIDATGRIHLAQFYFRRALRIFPVFYAYLLVIGILTLLKVLHIAGQQFVFAGLFLWNYKHAFVHISDDGDWFLGHLWSLAVEEQFYLIWPLALSFLGVVRGRRWCVGLLFLFPFFRVASYFLWPAARPQGSIMFHTAADPLICGCWLALVEARQGSLPRLWKDSSAAIAATAALFLLFSPVLGTLLGSRYANTAGPIFEALCITYIVRFFVQHPGNLVGSFLNNDVVSGVGRLSYGLYIWQQLFLTNQNHTILGRFPVNLLCAFVVSACSYHLLEQPFLRLRSRLRYKSVAEVGGTPGSPLT